MCVFVGACCSFQKYLRSCSCVCVGVSQAFALHGLVESARDVLRAMRASGLMLSTRDWDFLIEACGAAGDAKGAENVLAEMAAEGFEPDVETANTLINACGVAGDVDLAVAVLSSMVARSGGSGGSGGSARGVGRRDTTAAQSVGPRRVIAHASAIAPNSRTFACAIRACGMHGNLTGACVMNVIVGLPT